MKKKKKGNIEGINSLLLSENSFGLPKAMACDFVL